MFLINRISLVPYPHGSAGNHSARPSVFHLVCNAFATFTPAQGMSQPLVRRGMYTGEFPQLTPRRRCASQVAVERTTDSGIACANGEYPNSGYRSLCNRISAGVSQPALISAPFLTCVNEARS